MGAGTSCKIMTKLAGTSTPRCSRFIGVFLWPLEPLGQSPASLAPAIDSCVPVEVRLVFPACIPKLENSLSPSSRRSFPKTQTVHSLICRSAIFSPDTLPTWPKKNMAATIATDEKSPIGRPTPTFTSAKAIPPRIAPATLPQTRYRITSGLMNYSPH